MPALKVFTVSYGGIRIKVRILSTVKEVHREHQCTARQYRGGDTVHAFFLPNFSPSAKHAGSIVLPLNGHLKELVPHEVAHAVVWATGGVLARDDEDFCNTLGIFCARIFRSIEQMGVAA